MCPGKRGNPSLTLLAPAVVEPLLAKPDVAINLESVQRPVMPLDWQAQGAVFTGW